MIFPAALVTPKEIGSGLTSPDRTDVVCCRLRKPFEFSSPSRPPASLSLQPWKIITFRNFRRVPTYVSGWNASGTQAAARAGGSIGVTDYRSEGVLQ